MVNARLFLDGNVLAIFFAVRCPLRTLKQVKVVGGCLMQNKCLYDARTAS